MRSEPILVCYFGLKQPCCSCKQAFLCNARLNKPPFSSKRSFVHYGGLERCALSVNRNRLKTPVLLTKKMSACGVFYSVQFAPLSCCRSTSFVEVLLSKEMLRILI